MLFADVIPDNWPAALAAIVTALVGAWLSLRVHQIDAQARQLRRRLRAEKHRCDSLERRVGELEKSLAACLRSKKPHRPKPRR